MKTVTDAGFGSHASQWLIDAGFFSDVNQIKSTDICEHASEVEHSHFFTASGLFGSRDDKGEQVDDGDYKVIDADTISFPSH